jgi:hypothetical protein
MKVKLKAGVVITFVLLKLLAILALIMMTAAAGMGWSG